SSPNPATTPAAAKLLCLVVTVLHSPLRTLSTPSQPHPVTRSVSCFLFTQPHPHAMVCGERLQEVARRLAGAAPNGAVVDSYGITRGGSRTGGSGGGGVSYIVALLEFGGNTAGMFGAAREFRVIAVTQGVQYTLRITTTRHRFLAQPEVRQLLRGVVDSFEVLQ
ncbi:hypothetical protein Agub_g11270, partial [Astrephomene gubernaculifera]